MRIAVLGPGGVGGFIAAALARSGEEVTVVAREPTAQRIAERGIELTSPLLGDFTAAPRAVARLEEAVDVLLVATKATSLAPALERIAEPPELVVPLLNGVEHMGVLRERLGPERVAAGVIRIEADRPAPGRVIHTSPSARVDVASARPELQAPLQRLVAALPRAGVPARIGAGEAEVLWSKLMRLSALALTTSAGDRPLGEIREDPRWRSALEGAIRESEAVANAEGAALDGADTLAELEAAHPGLGSSMQRDIHAGRLPELDAIAGAVLRAGARHGIACPTTAWLSERVARRAGIAPPSAA